MNIHFKVNIKNTFYFNVKARLTLKSEGVLSLNGDDYDNIPEGLTKEEFIEWIYDTYLEQYDFDEDNTTLNKDDVELSYSKYLNAQKEY